MSAATVRPTPRLGSTRRESYLEWIRERYPTFKPENDYEIVTLVQGNCSAPESELRSLLDKQLLLDIKFALGLESLGAVALLHPAEADDTFQRFIWHARTILDAPGTLAREKPNPWTPNVLCRAIPDSPYAIRLFPSLLAQNEWCMDFVDLRTGDAINAPPGFQIYSARDSGTLPWLGGDIHLVRPIEGFRGGTDVPNAPGDATETFVLRDGQMCLLRRKGHRDVLFQVPMRAQILDLVRAQVDELDFPRQV